MSDTFDPDFKLNVSTAGSGTHRLSKFHAADTKGRPRSWSSFNFDSYTLRILTAILPSAKASALIHDHYFKRALINNPNGSRKTNDQLYGGDDKMELIERSSKSLFGEPDGDFLVRSG
ncbi:hypothetical protein LTS10_005625 [Elasticomyces elasticus]|nr:hypothetical protein LTS10_005625 [Elasticomyces elasticus]